MMWWMNGGTCAALHFLPVKSNVNPEYFLALVDGHETQLAPVPPIHQLLPQMLRVHLPPLRNGGMPAVTGSGNAVVRPYLIFALRTRMLNPTRRKNLQKFWNSMRRRRRISISRNAWKCGRILPLWFTLWMALRVARLGVMRRGWPPT
jgi:hypothetical protein